MSGPIALHGGGEFMPGDEPFLAALLAAAGERVRGSRPIRVAIVPTAAARGRPDLAAANGVAAFERVAAGGGFVVESRAVDVVDAASAADPDRASVLAAADVIHLPGGDPDLIPPILAGSEAWRAIRRAWAGGAVLAGASAGAMALASWTWTAGGGITGLGIVPGLVVVPHASAASWMASLERFGAWAPAHLGALGLEERTGAISDDVESISIRWRVVGQGEVRWQAVRGGATTVAGAGETLETSTHQG